MSTVKLSNQQRKDRQPFTGRNTEPRRIVFSASVPVAMRGAVEVLFNSISFIN